MDGFAGVVDVGAGTAFTGGRRENSDGDGAMKERYWSKTCTHQPGECKNDRSYLIDEVGTHLFNQLPSTITSNRRSQLLQ